MAQYDKDVNCLMPSAALPVKKKSLDMTEFEEIVLKFMRKKEYLE